VTQSTAPSLDGLNTLTAPAWLWDGDRMRVVWANQPGVRFFGCSSLFDLIEMPFDEADPGVARVRELARQVKRGESWQEMISFASAVSDSPFSAEVHVHALADGRNGLLLVAESAQLAGNAASGGDSGFEAGVLESLPVAMLICAADGKLRFANAAARDIWRGSMPDSLAALAGSEVADGLMARASRAGIAGISSQLKTGFGTRDFRLVARRLGSADETAGFSVVLEDVTDRRVLEQQARGDAPAGTAAPEPPASAPARAPVQAVAAPVAKAPAEPAASGLDKIRAAIEAVSLEDKPTSRPPEREPAEIAPDAASAKFDVSPVVRKSLSGVKRAVVLYRSGKLVYANAAAAALLGYEADDELASREDIAGTVADVPGKTGVAELQDRSGGLVAVHVEKSTFPWNDGAMPLAVLTALDVSTRPAAPVPLAAPATPARTATADEAPVTVQEVSEPSPEPAEEEAPAEAEPEPPETQEETCEAAEPASAVTEPSAEQPVDLNELLSILDTASDGIVFLSETGDITWMSAGAEALFGVHAASVIDTPLAGLMDKASAKTVRDYVAALGDRGLSSLFNSGREVTARMQDGGEVPLFLTMRRTASAIAGIPASAYCAVLRDITQWKKTEAELREARDRAEASSKQKSEFLARMSHELRTPLNAILGFSDVMRKGEFGKLGNERYEGYANDIHTSGEYLLSLVNDLLDLSKVEAGKLELNFTSVDLGGVIDNCIKLMQNEATGARVVLRKSIAAGLPQVVADQRSLKQVMLNLISNAIKFTDPGGQVIISARMTDNGELLLAVSDTGVGMDESQLKEALQPFSRIETAGRQAHGTGLGLPLTKALVEANRARFAISSEPRKGTRIDITFPTTRVLAG
jgi:PAS domain S-box-containing protein